MKIDFLLFHNPEDPLIYPVPPQTSFNRKLYASLRGYYCKPQLQGGWLVARRSLDGSCGSSSLANKRELPAEKNLNQVVVK